MSDIYNDMMPEQMHQACIVTSRGLHRESETIQSLMPILTPVQHCQVQEYMLKHGMAVARDVQ